MLLFFVCFARYPSIGRDRNRQRPTMNDARSEDYAQSLESDLTDRYGPLLSSSALTRVLGYASADAFRQALARKTVPVPVFRMPNRRGHFALTRDVAPWLAKQRQAATVRRYRHLAAQGQCTWFEAFGGVPAVLVPDNLKSAVLKTGSEPVLNRAYLELARHYETAILPARAYRPKDKAKAEVSVQIAQRWILAWLRNQTFFSLPELNRAIAALVAELNDRPFKRLPGCRRSRFETYERPALRPLPAARFEPSRWSAMQTIPPDYHLPVEGHWYSVPFHLVGRKAEARIGGKVVEIFCDGKRVASHARGDAAGGHTTAPEHQPPQHRAYAERSPEHFLAWAGEVGPSTLAVVRHQLDRKLPLLGLPACDALKRLARQHGPEVLELAAARALEIKSPTVKSIRSLISTKRYRRMQGDPPEQADLPLHHHNVRGPGYFTQQGGGAC